MKLKSLCLILTALLVASLLPIINAAQGNITKASFSSAKLAIEHAYRTNYVTGLLNSIRVRVGYSSAPEQAIVGKNGWFYLGDRYAKSISVHRGMLLPSPDKFEISGNRRLFIRDLAKKYGAKGTYFMIAPNKESVYPENLPEWANPKGAQTFTKKLFRENDPTFLNILPAMTAAKAKYPQPIYLKTDSHWNDIGAWEGYKELARIVSKDIPGVRFLSDSDVQINLDRTGPGGDISAFLFLRDMVSEQRPSVSALSRTSIEVSDFETGKVNYTGINRTIETNDTPILVKSSSPLNSERVLWIRDSFGVAMSPFIASTFSESIQVHWGKILNNDQNFKDLMDEYRPDLVIFTIVERNYFSIISDS